MTDPVNQRLSQLADFDTTEPASAVFINYSRLNIPKRLFAAGARELFFDQGSKS